MTDKQAAKLAREVAVRPNAQFKAVPEAASWVIADSLTGEVICETFGRGGAELAAQLPRYRVWAIGDWLREQNRRLI